MQETRHPSAAQSALNILHRIEDGILVGLLTLMILIASIQILMRNVLGLSIIWGDILVRILVLWIGLVGAMIACRTSGHIRIEIINRYLPGRVKACVSSVVHLFTASVCALAAFHGFRFLSMERQFGSVAFAAVPTWVCEAIIPMAFTVITARYLIQFWMSLKKPHQP